MDKGIFILQNTL